ncbi:MAG: DUF3306 domain-containing protein [Polaromonas sp.]|uniref:DUF3306 domain-containing protein n=1 Tax=Polaromonas sp. TaxID=1869339 RepID=UPI00272EF85F|nr:DUF3306 domain-containing protein [Polaromonas sp.]MDP1741463.1 DUF3306 domain-containing protein [Polaromonas sp.]MDP1956323.1 DUF3306 domain-containing protein [Polaromonas sp.]MDP3356915.1 DUF3306 domain-containing protein [Polaromonas sp.]MDP3752195.1 DUF3306 domain-containing protein [Polaromonas sp.]
MAEDSPGFLGRWSRRKTDVLQGKPLAEPALVPPAAENPLTVTPAPVPEPVIGEAPVEERKLLTLDDVKLLNKDSDFKPFMANDVGPDVRNAAMKKLFADPHFNVMDGLDIYIDDYSKSDPIPESMLRQMASAKFLKLFDDEDKPDEAAGEVPAPSPRENANKPADETVAQSSQGHEPADPTPLATEPTSQPESPTDCRASQENHAHIDLRLQPDHAAPAPGAGRST